MKNCFLFFIFLYFSANFHCKKHSRKLEGGDALQSLIDMILARIGGGYMYDKTKPSIEDRANLTDAMNQIEEAK